MRATRSIATYMPVWSNSDSEHHEEGTSPSSTAINPHATVMSPSRRRSGDYPSPTTSDIVFTDQPVSPDQDSPSAGRARGSSKALLRSPLGSRRAKVAKAKFTWSKASRQALHLLREKFQCDWSDTVAVFNEIFRDVISSCGFSNGLERGRLAVQHNDRLRENCKPWQEVLKKHLTPQENLELEQISRNIERHLAKRSDRRVLAPVARSSVHTSAKSASNHVAVRPHDRLRVDIRIKQRAILRREATSTTGNAQQPVTPITPTKKRTNINFAAYIPPTPTSDSTSIVDTPPSHRRPIGAHVEQDYEYIPISQQAAHPPLPALYYRYYDETSHGVNDVDGFVSSQCMYTQGGYPPPPHATDPLLYMLLENHINRNPVSSPFISVSIGLFWVVRMALKSLARGIKFPRIAIIDASRAAQRNSAFFVPPYHKQLKLKKIFTEGAWHYSGSHEWVIWAQIPKEAIIYDVSIQELQAKIDRLPTVARAFRFDVLGTTKQISNEKLRLYLKDHQVALSSALTIGFAHLLLGFGVDATTPEHMIAKLVSDFIQGWHVGIDADSPERWKRHASIFAFELTDGITPAVTEARFQTVENAFLCGLGSGLGDFNWQKNDILTRRMRKRADAVGLDMEDSSRRLLEAVVIPSRPSTDLSRYRYDGKGGSGSRF